VGDDLHRLEVTPVEQWAAHGADRLAEAVASALAVRSRCLLALSGGTTPGPVLAELATRDLPWERVTVLQADERLAPRGHPDRNLTGLEAALGALPVTWMPLPVDRLLAIGASGAAPDPEVLAAAFEVWTRRLVELADDPPVLDVVQLGLGADGHTASLVSGDPAVMELRRYLTLTGPYQGYRRLTLTRAVFDRAERVVWLVRGPDKAAPLGRLLAGDLSIPAGLLRPRHSLIVADAEAARQG
jgi:6-phosphogluconolactonase